MCGYFSKAKGFDKAKMFGEHVRSNMVCAYISKYNWSVFTG
jgi:hypothetical protein